MRIFSVHAGYVLDYSDTYEYPLRYTLHGWPDEAMLLAQTEYGVSPDEWEEVRERLPWKDRHTRRSRRKRRC